MKIGIEEHALLYGLLVKNACAMLGEEKGKEIMAKATRHYGICRGKRMKKNALRLAYGDSTAGYMLSGEWQGEPGENQSELFYEKDSVRSEVHVCKWCDTWKKYDLMSYGPLYCQYIDKAIAEGFAGDFTLHANSILSAGDPVCMFVWDRPADKTAIAKTRKNRQESLIRPFSFHCGELLACTKEILEENVPQEAAEILRQTKNDFRTLKPEAAEFFVQIIQSVYVY